MSSSYWGLEAGGRWELEANTFDWLIEDATTFAIGKELIVKYDIAGLVNNSLILKYDIFGLVDSTLTITYDIADTIATNLLVSTGCTTPSATDTETILKSVADGPLNYAFWVSLENMASGDEVEIRVYKWNNNGSNFELWDDRVIDFDDLTGPPGHTTDSKPAAFIPFIPSYRYRVTIKQTKGTVREYCWELFKIP